MKGTTSSDRDKIYAIVLQDILYHLTNNETLYDAMFKSITPREGKNVTREEAYEVINYMANLFAQKLLWDNEEKVNAQLN